MKSFKVGDKVIREYFPFAGYIVDIEGNRERRQIGQHGFKEGTIIAIEIRYGVKKFCFKDKPEIEGGRSIAQFFTAEEMKENNVKKVVDDPIKYVEAINAVNEEMGSLRIAYMLMRVKLRS